jgi:hypothetical protein
MLGKALSKLFVPEEVGGNYVVQAMRMGDPIFKSWPKSRIS